MKRFVLLLLIFSAAAAMLPAESVMTGLFEAADQVSSDIPGILRRDGDLLLGGLTYNLTQVQLGDLLADLTANRLAGRSGFFPQIVKNYTMLQYPPAQASWVFSGTLYEAGAGYLLILQLIDNANGSQLKGWEFALGSEGIEPLLQPSVLAAGAGVWDRFEPNNLSIEAAVIELPFNESGLTLGEGDEDWFAFEVPESDSESVMMLNAATGGMMDTYLELSINTLSPSDSRTSKANQSSSPSPRVRPDSLKGSSMTAASVLRLFGSKRSHTPAPAARTEGCKRDSMPSSPRANSQPLS